MGGNGSYNKSINGILEVNRSFRELNNRIDGHKILVQRDDKKKQIKVPENSNSDKPIYLCASVDKNNKVTIKQIGVYKNHKLVATIDLKFDKQGNLIPYDNGKGSHMHRFKEDENGDVGRKSHAKDNVFPIPRKYKSLIKKIEQYNKENHKDDN